MHSRSPRSACTVLFVLSLVAASSASAGSRLRVCADPNNLPYSNAAGEGFENRIAEVLAADLGETVEYTWWAQRRGFLRSTLKAGLCDVVMGVPSAVDMVRTTAPYYRSTFVFVTRADRGLDVRILDDPRLRTLRVGVQLVGDDGANPPAAQALAARGITGNLVGFMVYGNHALEKPAARIVDAVAAGDVDIAIVWGPQAGYFAPRTGSELRLVAVSPEIDPPFLPFVYDISLAVRRDDDALARRLEDALTHQRSQIDAILAQYGVPRVDAARIAPVDGRVKTAVLAEPDR